MDVLSDEERIARGDRAANLLSAGVFDEALNDLRDCLLGGIESIQTDDTENVMAIVRQMRSLKQLRFKLEGWAQDSRRLREAQERG